MLQSLRYLFWGQGETGPLVYSILERYREWAHSSEQPQPAVPHEFEAVYVQPPRLGITSVREVVGQPSIRQLLDMPFVC